MSRLSGNEKRSRRDFGDNSQWTNFILDSGAMCHMTPQVSDFIPGSLENMDNYIEFADEHYVTAKQKLICTCPGHVPDASRTSPYCPVFGPMSRFHGDIGQAPKC